MLENDPNLQKKALLILDLVNQIPNKLHLKYRMQGAPAWLGVDVNGNAFANVVLEVAVIEGK
jgi:hypothetical protein